MTDTSIHALPPHKPPTFDAEGTYLITHIGDRVGPYMATAPQDKLSANIMGWNLVAAYSPQNEAEALHAARIVMMSFAALDMLSDARKPGLSPTLKLKHIAAAVSLNRTISDSERSLEQQKRLFREERREVIRMERPRPEPALDPAAEAEIEAMTEQAMRDYDETVAALRAHQAAAAAAPPAAEPAPKSAAAPAAVVNPSNQPAAPQPRPFANPLGAHADWAAAPRPATPYAGAPHPAQAGVASAPEAAAFDAAADLRRQIAAAKAAIHRKLDSGTEGQTTTSGGAAPLRRSA